MSRYIKPPRLGSPDLTVNETINLCHRVNHALGQMGPPYNYEHIYDWIELLRPASAPTTELLRPSRNCKMQSDELLRAKGD